MMLHRRTGPELLHHLDHLVGAPTTTVEGLAHRVELLAHPARADAEQEPALGQVLHRGDGAGRGADVAQRQDAHARAETDAPCPRREVAGQDEGVHTGRGGGVAGEPGLVVRVRASTPDGLAAGGGDQYAGNPAYT